MAKDRETPCIFYICEGSCTKKHKASHKKSCQKCGDYKPRVHEKHKNQKKEKLQKIREKE